MKPTWGLWSLIAFYLLMTFSTALPLNPIKKVSNCLESCLSVDLNEVDSGQMSFQTKTSSQFASHLCTHQNLVVEALFEISTDAVSGFYFLDLPPYSSFLKDHQQPPISRS